MHKPLEFILEATSMNTGKVSEGRLLIAVRVTSVKSLNPECCDGYIESLRKLYELRAINPPESFTPRYGSRLKVYVSITQSANLPKGIFYPRKMELLDESGRILSVYEECSL
ncbi:hypothetical protein J4443_03760 [Candidatus Woesearchaeota archaeon]|nr:hypothetical protein [Candidatus Woesearchaeota archaeon]